MMIVHISAILLVMVPTLFVGAVTRSISDILLIAFTGAVVVGGGYAIAGVFGP